MVQDTSRDLLAAWTVQWVVANSQPFFEDLASDYAACSAEERREVETEVRDELERIGMTDDRRRTLDELWERLRSTDPA